MNNNTRNKNIDIIKGIGIILMVWGHSGAPFTHFIYLFHMAIFFIASGWLWNDKYVSDKSAARRFIFRKLKSLYFPYVVCNGLFVLMNNIFIRIGIYTTNPEFQNLPSGNGYGLAVSYDFKGMLINVIKVLMFHGGSQLGGATWFLLTLFEVNIAYLIVKMIEKVLHDRYGVIEYATVVIAMISIIIVCSGIAANSVDERIYNEVARFVVAYLIYYIGVLIRKYSIIMKYVDKAVALFTGLALIILVIMNRFGSIAMGTGQVTNVIYFVVVSLCGWVLLWGLATFISKLRCSWIEYLGKHTLWIVLLHFLSFKIVSCAYIIFSGKDWLYLASFPVIIGVHGLWVAYVVVGVSVPALAEMIVNKVKLKCFGYTLN